jgi:hypothetical protein
MAPNMAMAERVFRLGLAVLIVNLCYMGVLSGILALVLGIVAFFLPITGLTGHCPLHA